VAAEAILRTGRGGRELAKGSEGALQRLIRKLRRRAIRLIACALGAVSIAVLPAYVAAEAFGNAEYDAMSDELIVIMLYSGTNPDHQFSLQWDRCIAHPDGTKDVTAQVIDSEERDGASQEFKKSVHFSLKDLPCRPARVTLRASPGSYVALQVPAAP
jgi:hypothetical protein